MKNLVGKVVRLHSKSEPNKVKLYMITDDDYDSLSQGKVRYSTVDRWVKNGLNITVYDEIDNNGIDNEIKGTDKYKHFNHHHELTCRHKFVDFGDGEFIANIEAIPLLKALSDVGLRTRTHHIDSNDSNAFFSIVLDDGVECYIKEIYEKDSTRTKYNGKKEVLINWGKKKEIKMKKTTLQNLMDFECELAHLQNKHGIFVDAEIYEEWDENTDGDYLITGYNTCIVYKDIRGNIINYDDLE